MIKDSFVKCVFLLLKDDVISTLRNQINHYRFHPESDIAPTVSKAVTILYECDNEEELKVAAEFEVRDIMRIDGQKLVTSDAYHFYCHKTINKASMQSVLTDVGSESLADDQIDSSCSVEKQICDKFAIHNIESTLQDTVITCLLKNEV